MMLQDWILKHASNNNNYYFSVKKKELKSLSKQRFFVLIEIINFLV